MIEEFKQDYLRSYKKNSVRIMPLLARLLLDLPFRYQFYGRLSQNACPLFRKAMQVAMRHLGGKIGIEITNWEKIGGGLVLGHACGITINPSAIIGNNCLLFKGSTVGSVRSGRRSGCPSIGNNVVIGSNAMVCGGITIGDNAFIAANSFVDFDVPSHALVIGNPAVIKAKKSPSVDYF